VAGILTATDPLFTAVLALWLIRSEAPDRRRTAGLIIGFVGVVALLGIDLRGSAMELLGAGAVILSALGYASAALLYRRWLADQTALAITALMTVISGLALFLGVGLLGERLTIGAIAGLVLIAVGAWLATRRQQFIVLTLTPARGGVPVMKRSNPAVPGCTFTPQITAHSERRPTVEIIAGDGIGFSIPSSMRQSLFAMPWWSRVHRSHIRR